MSANNLSYFNELSRRERKRTLTRIEKEKVDLAPIRVCGGHLGKRLGPLYLLSEETNWRKWDNLRWVDIDILDHDTNDGVCTAHRRCCCQREFVEGPPKGQIVESKLAIKQ